MTLVDQCVKRVLLFEHRKAWGDRTNASVPAETFVSRWSAGTRLSYYAG